MAALVLRTPTGRDPGRVLHSVESAALAGPVAAVACPAGPQPDYLGNKPKILCNCKARPARPSPHRGLIPIFRYFIPRLPPGHRWWPDNTAIGQSLGSGEDAIRKFTRHDHLPRLPLHEHLKLVGKPLRIVTMFDHAIDVEVLPYHSGIEHRKSASQCERQK